MKKITRTSHCTCCIFWSGRPLGLHTPHIGEDYSTHPSLLSSYGTQVAGNTCSLALVDVALHQHRSVGRSGPHRQQRQLHVHHMKLNVAPPQVPPPHVSPPHVSPPHVSPPHVSPPHVSPTQVPPPHAHKQDRNLSDLPLADWR